MIHTILDERRTIGCFEGPKLFVWELEKWFDTFLACGQETARRETIKHFGADLSEKLACFWPKEVWDFFYVRRLHYLQCMAMSERENELELFFDYLINVRKFKAVEGQGHLILGAG